jgi:hypothetical protein
MRGQLRFFLLLLAMLAFPSISNSGDIPKPWKIFSQSRNYNAYYDTTSVRKNKEFIDVQTLEVNELKGMGTTKDIRFQLSTGYCAYGHIMTYKGTATNVMYETNIAKNGYVFGVPLPYEKRLLKRLKKM